MFAVREEVEVLKEKIAELMDRINQLEVENTILKANASQETLTQLSTTVVVSQLPPQQTQAPMQQPQQPLQSLAQAPVTPQTAQNQSQQQQTPSNPPPAAS